VLITNRSGVYSCSCGGVAYLTVFDDVGDFYKPALVFYDALGGGNEKYVADAISHEAGHNMGLGHDGTSSSGYYSGHGSGATGWAPIMGVGYYQPLVQWSKGEYAGANNTQDDYAVMQNTGLPLRADDHGNSIASATAMVSSTANGVTTFTASGVIERPIDADVFSFAAGAGSVTINVSPAPRAPMLDVVATLRNSAGTIIATSNPTDSLPAAMTANLTAAGTYYVSVDGVGKGDPLTTGYTDYGSVGQYTVSVTTQATTSQPPTAVISATPTSGTAPLTVNFSATGSTDSDGTIVSYAWTFGDGGSQTGGTTAQRTYSTAGSYTASLTVTDNAGLTDTKSVVITVQAQTTTYLLTVGKAGTGAGTVSSSPAGIACGTTCSASYTANTTVTLTAAPTAGSTFAGWSGACSGTGSCTVSMTAARSVTATFNPISYTLTVSKGGMATGVVASSPSGIDCGADCTEDYSSGASVTLSATPAAGTAFTGWSGACSGSGACTVSMTSARSVAASFDVIRTMSVANIAMSLSSSRSRTNALASVTVRDGSNNPVPGAQVTGTWSGVVSGNATVTTNSSGAADFRSASVKATTGSTFTFTVTGITLSGYTYDAASNVETRDSITR